MDMNPTHPGKGHIILMQDYCIRHPEEMLTLGNLLYLMQNGNIVDCEGGVLVMCRSLDEFVRKVEKSQKSVTLLCETKEDFTNIIKVVGKRRLWGLYETYGDDGTHHQAIYYSGVHNKIPS